jgi:hypothetical protein
MRVNYSYTDNADDEYTIEAEVHPVDHNRIQIVTIKGDNNVELTMDEFEVEEQRDILWGAKQAAEELDKSEEPSYDDDLEESNLEDY